MEAKSTRKYYIAEKATTATETTTTKKILPSIEKHRHRHTHTHSHSMAIPILKCALNILSNQLIYHNSVTKIGDRNVFLLIFKSWRSGITYRIIDEAFSR